MHDHDAATLPAPRTWGPFTGRQITTVLVTLIVMMLLPVGAWAVTGQGVFVTDATTGKTAKVDGAGTLQTKVQGTVTATPAPTTQYVWTAPVGTAAAGGSFEMYTVPAGKALVITTLNLDYVNNRNGFSTLTIGPAGCTWPATWYDYFDEAAPQGHENVHYEPGIIARAGQAVCISSFAQDGWGSINGYLIPLASAPTAPTSVAAPAPAQRRG